MDRATRRQFREGDSDAVRAVYRRYGRLVYAVAFRSLGDRGLAEEATQQTFLKAWRAAATVNDRKELRPWLLTIVRRIVIDLRRREALRVTAPLEAVPTDDVTVVTLPVSADVLCEAWEVRQAVQDLPAAEREVVRLQHFEGMTHREIAGRTCVPIGTVKSRSSRAHRRLAFTLAHLRTED